MLRRPADARFHLAGATHPFPPELCNTWVVDAEDEPLTDSTTPQHQIDAILRSRMFGAFGLSARLMHWTEDAFQAMQKAIAQYKRLRPFSNMAISIIYCRRSICNALTSTCKADGKPTP